MKAETDAVRPGKHNAGYDQSGSPDARDALVRWERERGSNVSQSPPVTPRKSVTPEAGGPTLVEGAVEGGIGDWGEVVSKLRPPLVTVVPNSAVCWKTRKNPALPGVSDPAVRLHPGDNVSGEADNQQGSRSPELSFGELTPQRLHAELLNADARETRAYLLGALRDGTFNRFHRTIRISQSDPRWLELLRVLFSKLGSRSWIYREGVRNVWVIETLCGLETEQGVDGPLDQTAFVRGYFDAEGGIPRSPESRFYIQFVQKDRTDLEVVWRYLNNLDVHCGRIHNPSVRVGPNYWRFYVLAASHEDFIRRVGSWHPRKRLLLEARLETRMKI